MTLYDTVAVSVAVAQKLHTTGSGRRTSGDHALSGEWSDSCAVAGASPDDGGDGRGDGRGRGGTRRVSMDGTLRKLTVHGESGLCDFSYIFNHATVLDLTCAMRPRDCAKLLIFRLRAGTDAAVAAAAAAAAAAAVPAALLPP